jgi:hypothetical protein
MLSCPPSILEPQLFSPTFELRHSDEEQSQASTPR